MTHIELRFAATDRQSAEALDDALRGLLNVSIPATALFENKNGGWELTAYLGDLGEQTFEADIERPLHRRLGDLPACEIIRFEDRDWVAEGLKDLKPVIAGRFVVHGEHDRQRIAIGRTPIAIDAGQAFGTGHHGTTVGCLEVISDIAGKGFRPRRVLDLGTGSGILAIAAAKTFGCPVVAGDIDPVSAVTARANARKNGAAPRIRFAVCPGTRSDEIRARAPYDLVMANILAKPLIGLAPEIAGVTAMGGLLVISGLLDRQVPPVATAFASRGYVFKKKLRRQEWATLALAKSAIGHRF